MGDQAAPVVGADGQGGFNATLGNGVRAVGIVRSDEDPEWAADAAIRIATFIGQLRPHTLLCNLEPDPPVLDRRLGGSSSTGLSGAVRGESRLTDVAVLSARRSFTFLPAGRHPEPTRRLVSRSGFRALVDRGRQRGATVLLYVSSRDLGPKLDELVDGWIVLGDLDRRHGRWLGQAVIGHLQPPRNRRTSGRRGDRTLVRNRLLGGPSRDPPLVDSVPVVLPAADPEELESRLAGLTGWVTGSVTVRLSIGVGLAMAVLLLAYLILR